MAEEKQVEEVKETKKPEKSASDKNLLAALSYITVLSVVIYILEKDNDYVKFHSRQGIIIFIMSILGVFPLLGWPIGIAAFVLMIVGAVKAYQGEKYRIPVIADLSEKITF